MLWTQRQATEYHIDVLQIHRLDRDTPREEIMKALNDVVESGKVRYIGASSVRRTLHSVRILASKTSRKAVSRPIASTLYTKIHPRWPPGDSKPSRTLPTSMAGTTSSPCKTTTTYSTAKRSAKCSPPAATLASAASRESPPTPPLALQFALPAANTKHKDGRPSRAVP